MEYIIGAVIGGISLYIFSLLRAKSKVDSFNKMCQLKFTSWNRIYSSSVMPEKYGMARAFMIQSLHLAGRMGVFSSVEMQSMEHGMRQENPISVVDEWLDTVLHDVNAVCGQAELERIEARVAGAMMLVCLKGVNPQGDLKRFLQTF